MHGFPRGRTAIVGAATFGVGKAPGFEAIDLAEGPRMMSRGVGIAPGLVAIGMAVRARIVVENDAPLVVFDPA